MFPLPHGAIECFFHALVPPCLDRLRVRVPVARAFYRITRSRLRDTTAAL